MHALEPAQCNMIYYRSLMRRYQSSPRETVRYLITFRTRQSSSCRLLSHRKLAKPALTKHADSIYPSNHRLVHRFSEGEESGMTAFLAFRCLYEEVPPYKYSSLNFQKLAINHLSQSLQRPVIISPLTHPAPRTPQVS